MALPPQKFREIVFQLLYSQDFTSIEVETVDYLMQEVKVTKRSVLDACEKVGSIVQKLPEIDQKIREVSTEYSFERISKAELAIIRLGIFELLHDATIPPKVALAEAIRLCRKFGTPESSHFVNAILDGIYANSNQPLPV